MKKSKKKKPLYKKKKAKKKAPIVGGGVGVPEIHIDENGPVTETPDATV